MDVIHEWNKLEADFLRWYKIDDPLNITWRRFLLLLSGLPMDKSLFFAPYYEAMMEDEDYSPRERNSGTSDYKKELDAKANRRGRPRTRMSLDQFIAQSNGLGARTNLNDIT